MANPSLSSLIFLNTPTNFSHTLASLSATKHSVRARLCSIREDASFVLSVPSALGLESPTPFVGNARAGTWYIPPARNALNVYFKSTDGHHLNWSFSTRRLNLHLLPLLGNHGHIVVVDSTRRGKVMPDALSKTIPTWIAVMNRVLFPEAPDSHGLVTSRQAVGESEHVQIEQRLPEFAERLRALNLDWRGLREQLGRPMRPLFASPDMDRPSLPDAMADWRVLVLVSASKLQSSDADEGYVQGAADDQESWALGLTPDLFWRNERFLLDADIGDAETERRVEEASHAARESGSTHRSAESPPRHLYLSQSSPAFYILPCNEAGRVSDCDLDIRILCCSKMSDGSEGENSSEDVHAKKTPRTLRIPCPPGKLGSRALKDGLPRISAFIVESCRAFQVSHPRILYACATGRDISVGVALAMACQFANEAGDFEVQWEGPQYAENKAAEGGKRLDKTSIRQRLVLIQNQMEAESGGPSSTTLKAVNGYLLERPSWT